MLEMGGETSVLRHDSPAVIQVFDFLFARVHHRFYGKGHAALKDRPFVARHEVRNLWLLMERSADAVSGQFAHHRVAVALGMSLHRSADVHDTLAGSRLSDPAI